MTPEINAINQLKQKFLKQNLQDLSVLKEVRNSILQEQTLKHLPIVQAFSQDLEAYIDSKGKSRFNLVKQVINSGNDHLIFSAFAAPYFKDLSLDGFYYQPIAIPSKLKAAFPSPAFPVNFVTTSRGFESQQVVALFPENHLDHVQLQEDRIFYFMDRFVSRFFNITKPILKYIASHQLSRLRFATSKEIEYAASCWVHLHEYFHRQGAMPIPRYLDVKSNKALAGLEELRVDLLSILTCLEQPDFIPNSQFVGEFILIERLFRYGVESPAVLTYDAISSQVLFKYLLDHGGLEVNAQHVITLKVEMIPILKQLSEEISVLETHTVEAFREQVKNGLLSLVNQYVDYNPLEKQFLYHDQFKRLKMGIAA